MGFIDDTIVNLQRIAGDVVDRPQSIVDATIGTLREGVASGLELGGQVVGVGGVPGETGPRGAEGMTTIRLVGEGTGNVSSLVRPVQDLSTFMGGHWSGGNGMFATRTRVERLEIATGRITITSLVPGSPHLMNSDITAAKKVFRRSAALQKRMPRRTVKESDVTKLKNAAVAAATANVSCPPQVCAPKC